MNRTALARRWASGVVPGLLLASLSGLVAPTPADAQYMPSQTPVPPPFFALQNARIVTGTGDVIENGTVVIANGLIEAVGADIDVPGDVWVIDASGLTIYPGLFDGLSQVGMASPGANAAAGGGGAGGNPFALIAQQANQPRTVRPEDRPATNSWINAADMLDADSDAVATWRSGGFTNTLVAPDDGIVTGQGAVLNLAGDEQEMVVKSPAALRVTMSGAGGFRSFPGSLMGVIAYIRQLYHDADHSRQYEARYMADPSGQPRPTYDRALSPIQDAIAGGWPTVMPANEVRQIRRAIKLGQDTGARPVLQGAHEAYGLADEIAAAGVPVLVNVDWPERNRDADPEAEESLTSLKRRAYAPTTPARLEEAGVEWAFYSGSAGSPRAMMDGVRTAIENGLSEEAALDALTGAPARIYGVDAMLGSVEAGKIANLVVTDGPLFDEGTDIRMVFVDGHKFEEEAPEPRPTEAPAVDMNGTWLLSLNNDSQEATAELEVSEDGTISGVIQGERGEQQITDGWVSGNEFSITASATMGPGMEVEIVYTGTVEGDSIEGNASFGGARNMDFTGTRPGGGVR
ncbi:amidohydrolase family protein [Candidatus Palauibacter sp.]|uniref:amidohydrolase family protein n=1 Tax=Candidatus Palauibacter sp. TaxID=3101350 RepID=UPI003B01D714